MERQPKHTGDYKPETVRFPDGTTGFIMVRDYSHLNAIVDRINAELASTTQPEVLDFPTDTKLREQLEGEIQETERLRVNDQAKAGMEHIEFTARKGAIFQPGVAFNVTEQRRRKK